MRHHSRTTGTNDGCFRWIEVIIRTLEDDDVERVEEGAGDLCRGSEMARMLGALSRRSSADLPAAFRLRLEHALAALTLMIAALVGAPAGAFEPGSLAIETRSGARHRFEIELATTPEDIGRGLMFRDAM